MKRALTIFGITSLALAAPAGDAQAEKRWPQWYVGLSGGMAFQNDADAGSLGEISFDNGFGVGVALGYRPHFENTFLDHTRYEVEMMHTHTDVSDITAGGASTTLNGEIKNLAFMANIYYDFDNSSRWTPYLGLGAGGADVELSSGQSSLDGSQGVFAYQFLGGLNFSPETIPFVDLGLGYRYFATLDPETVPGLEIENASHNIEFNAHFNF